MKNYMSITFRKPFTNELLNKPNIKYVLLSYFHIGTNSEKKAIDFVRSLHENGAKVLIDSGAFSYMRMLAKKRQAINFDDYLDRYINFINQIYPYIEGYFELDVQSVIGQDEYERLRSKLIRMTNKFPILVWHVLDDISIFKKYVDWILSNPNYNNRIGIGGVAVLSASRNKEVLRLIKELTIYASSRGIKVHGLGITSKVSRYIPFDSVDSFSYMYDYINNRPVNELGKIIDVYGYEKAWTRQLLTLKLFQYFAEVF